MSEHDAIRRVLAEYCFGTDRGDTDRWLATMTDDVIWDGGAFGRFEGKEAGKVYHAGAGDAPMDLQHINTNHVIHVDGDTATVESYLQLYNRKDPAAGLIFAGYYDDELAKRDGKWLIRRRSLS